MAEFNTSGLPNPRNGTRSPHRYAGDSGKIQTPTTPCLKHTKLEDLRTQDVSSQGSTTPSSLSDFGFGLPSPLRMSSSQLDSGYASSASSRSPFTPLQHHQFSRPSFFHRNTNKSQSKPRFFDIPIPVDLESRYRDLKLLYSEPLQRAVSNNKDTAGDLAMKLRYTGESPADAQLSVVVCCEKWAVGRVKRFFAQKDVLEDFRPHFKICIIPAPPRRLAGLSNVTVHSSPGSRATLCGTSIQFKSDRGSAFATLGGLVEIISAEGERTLYGLTAAHPLQRVLQMGPQRPQSLDLFLDSEDESSCDELETDDFIRIMEPSGLEFAVNSPPPPPMPHYLGSVHESFFQSTSLGNTGNRDWVLISIPREEWLPNLITAQNSDAPCNSLRVNLDHSQHSPRRPVLILTSRGPQRGSLLAGSSSVVLSPGQAFIDTLDFLPSSGSRLQPGDSGSWAVDESTGEALGHVVSIDIFGEAFVMPIRETLEDVRSQLGSARVQLPTEIALEHLRQKSRTTITKSVDGNILSVSLPLIDLRKSTNQAPTTHPPSTAAQKHTVTDCPATIAELSPAIHGRKDTSVLPSDKSEATPARKRGAQDVKRKEDDPQDEDTDEHDGGALVGPYEPGNGKTKAEQYSCPFRKRNPLRYNVREWQSCAKAPFKNMGELKKHLIKHHRPQELSHKCPGCFAKFPTASYLHQHMSQLATDGCQPRDGEASPDPLDEETVSVALSQRLRNRAQYFTWDRLWQELFPGDKEEDIPSPDFEVPVELYEVVREYNTSLPELDHSISAVLMGSYLEGIHPKDSGHSVNSHPLAKNVQQVVRDFMEGLFQRAQASTVGTASRHPRPLPSSTKGLRTQSSRSHLPTPPSSRSPPLPSAANFGQTHYDGGFTGADLSDLVDPRPGAPSYPHPSFGVTHANLPTGTSHPSPDSCLSDSDSTRRAQSPFSATPCYSTPDSLHSDRDYCPHPVTNPETCAQRQRQVHAPSLFAQHGGGNYGSTVTDTEPGIGNSIFSATSFPSAHPYIPWPGLSPLADDLTGSFVEVGCSSRSERSTMGGGPA